MSEVRRREIACAILLDTFGRLLLQQRNNNPEIIHPGKISLFGGHREGSESYLQCVVREIHEEISYFVPPQRFGYLTSYEAGDDEQNGAVVHAEFFIARELPVESLAITEGSPLLLKLEELDTVEPRFTPSTRYAISAFIKCEGSGSSGRPFSGIAS